MLPTDNQTHAQDHVEPDRFDALADEFITRVRTASIGPSTEVFLVHHCVDEKGMKVDPIKISLIPITTVTFPGRPEAAREFARAAHLDTIIGNINALVRQPPSGLVRLSGGPQFPVIIRDFSLEIDQPNQELGVMEEPHSNALPLHAEPPPLLVDEGGALRVGSSRVSFDLVIDQYENGMEPEEMVRAYDTLQLADVYAVIAYYLRHRSEVRAYLKRRELDIQALRSKIENARPCISREELLVRRGLREEAHAPVGQ